MQKSIKKKKYKKLTSGNLVFKEIYKNESS